MSSVLRFLSGIADFLLRALGGWDGCLKVLLLMMALDYLSGLIVALLRRSKKTLGGGVDSRAGLKGLLRKGLILMVVAVAAQVDLTLDSAVARAATTWFYIINEAISVVENAALAGVPLPAKLRGVLEAKK